MADAVILGAECSPLGKRNGGRARDLSADLFSDVLGALIGQVLRGCVSQVGPQSANVTRSAWLAAGLDQRAGAATCGGMGTATLIERI